MNLPPTPPSSPPDERLLIQRARRGDTEAFGRLVMHYTPRLYRVIRRMAEDDPEAEAVVQEAFLRVWQNLGRFREGQPFFPYLLTIALNLGRDQWRKARFQDFGGLEELGETLPDQDPGPEMLAEKAETLAALAGAIASLPPAYRAAIALRYDGGLSYEQMAAILELPVNTVRTHLRRAKLQLRASLADWE